MKKAHTVAAARRSPTEEIAGDDAGSLAAEKLRAPQACSPWRRLDAVPAQHGPDHARRDNETESGQLALDPSIPPVWVLGRQAQDQLAQLVGWPGGVSPPGSLGSRRDSLPSPGSCRLGHQGVAFHAQWANSRGCWRMMRCQQARAFLKGRSR